MANKRTDLKTMFKERQLIYGAWTASSDPLVAELFSTILKPNFIGVDMEHSTISLSDAKNIFSVAQARGCSVMPRVASHDKGQIRRLLDAGADGIIVPAVNNKHELENIIKAMKYPPLGERGYGISRAQNYGENFKDYTCDWNASSILIIIIETIEGIKNIEELVSNKSVDGVLIGEYDISGSFNIPGKITDDRVQEAKRVIIDSCEKYEKSCGILLGEINQTTLREAQKRNNFLILSTDIFILSQWSKKVNELISKCSIIR